MLQSSYSPPVLTTFCEKTKAGIITPSVYMKKLKTVWESPEVMQQVDGTAETCVSLVLVLHDMKADGSFLSLAP